MKDVAASNVAGTTGYGYFNSNGEGAYRSWNDFLLSIADFRKYDWERVEQSVEIFVVNKAIDSIQSLVEFCPEERKLIHGDFGSFNVLSDGQRITALIDWELSMFGDPVFECGNLIFWNGDKLKPVTII
jgi:hygromycin-B 4-O-kinase